MVVVTGENGILIPAETPEAIVLAVTQLLVGQHLRDRISAAALKTIESEFGITCWLKKIDDVYAELLG